MTGLVLTDEASSRPSATSCWKSATCASTTIRRARLSEQMAGRALSQPSLRHADDRLAARDREAQPRGCAGLLPALLHARQRHPGGRRRRDRRRGQAARRGDLRQDRAASARSARACARRSRAQVARAPRDVGRSAASSSRACSALYLVPSSHDRQGRRGPKRSKCSAQILGGGADSRLYRTLVVEQRARGQRRRLVQGTALDAHALRRLRHRRRRASRCEKLEAPIDAVIGDAARQRRSTAEEIERAKTRLIADTDLRAGQPGARSRACTARRSTTGATVDARAGAGPSEIRAVTADAGARRGRGASSTSAAR